MEHLEAFAAFSDKVWNYYLASQDLYARHFSQKDYANILLAAERLASEAEKELAVSALSTQMSCAPFGIAVQEVENDGFANPSILNLGQYCDGVILISKAAERTFLEISEQKQLKDILGPVTSIKELIFAHELFHGWFDICRKNEPAFQKRIGRGLFRRWVTPECTEEIAAHIFSKKMCKITCHPSLIQFIMLGEKAPFDETKLYKLCLTLKDF